MHCSMLIQILGLFTFSITYLEAVGEEMTTWSTVVIQVFWLATKFPGTLVEYDFAVLADSTGHLRHIPNGKPHSQKLHTHLH
jgi:hypothetical protein